MPLAHILYPPPTPQGMEEWAFAHWQHHIAITAGLRSTLGIDATMFNIYPVIRQDIENFLEQHQQSHNEFNAALGLQGQDLSAIDFSNKKQLDNFMYVNFSEHRAAAQRLGLTV